MVVKRKEVSPVRGHPDALEPNSVVQQRKTTRSAPPLAPTRLTFKAQEQDASAIALIAATRCGFDEREMAAMLMARPVMMATRVFDFIQTTDVQAEQQLSVLLDHFNLSFAALGGNAGAALQEWPQLSRVVMRDEKCCVRCHPQSYILVHYSTSTSTTSTFCC